MHKCQPRPPLLCVRSALASPAVYLHATGLMPGTIFQAVCMFRGRLQPWKSKPTARATRAACRSRSVPIFCFWPVPFHSLAASPSNVHLHAPGPTPITSLHGHTSLGEMQHSQKYTPTAKAPQLSACPDPHHYMYVCNHTCHYTGVCNWPPQLGVCTPPVSATTAMYPKP